MAATVGLVTPSLETFLSAVETAASDDDSNVETSVQLLVS